MALKIFRAEGGREKGLAASSPDAQDMFLESVGMMATLPSMASEDVLDPKIAEVLSCALRHKKVCLARLRDPYFTPEEWSRVSEAETDLLDEVLDGIAAATPDQVKRWRGKRKSILCRCIAHSCGDDLYIEVVSELVSIQPPLSDHEGGLLADVLLNCILKISGEKMKVQSVGNGSSIVSIRYILQLPSGEDVLYVGRPDFYVRRKISLRVREDGEDMSAETVRGVGEVQSPPGSTTKAKNRALTQSGIYTFRMFARTVGTSKLATVVLYKDITAHIALASIERVKDAGDEMGEVVFKFLGSPNPFNLRLAEDLRDFANIFVSALKMCN